MITIMGSNSIKVLFFFDEINKLMDSEHDRAVSFCIDRYKKQLYLNFFGYMQFSADFFLEFLDI